MEQIKNKIADGWHFARGRATGAGQASVQNGLMISVVIPTFNSARRGLGASLSALVPAVVDGVVREVIVADGGSTDQTLAIADEAGCEIVSTDHGRGRQLRAGVEKARFPWLLFLHPDTELETGWHLEAQQFIERVASGRRSPAAAVFRLTLDDEGLPPRMVEFGAAVNSNLLKLPRGEQGLLISRALYTEAGGYRDLPLMEDVDVVRRIGRGRVSVLRSRAIANAERYRQGGFVKRALKDQLCLALFMAGVSPERIQRIDGGRTTAGIETPVSVT